MPNQLVSTENWLETRRKEHQRINWKSVEGGSFIDSAAIVDELENNQNPAPQRIKDILQKSLSIQTLESAETAALLNVEDTDLWEEIFVAALEVKRKVYDNRIVTFAPLYLSNLCVNNCLYCGFRRDNRIIRRKTLSLDEIKEEVTVLAGGIGHKRLIVVFGEHPLSDIGYIADTIRTIYGVKVKIRNGWGQIRRVNVNAPPLSVDELKILKNAGIGTYQVFQETYHRETYQTIHPAGTLKSDYHWRLYCMHRALEAGIDDVGIGVLFGLYDWRFEIMGLLSHARELEEKFGIGPHTISFPRLEPAADTPFIQETKYKVNDKDFKKLIAVIRLSVPYTGMILTARELPQIRREVLSLGCTQTDASSRIGIGTYRERTEEQDEKRQQFLLGDTRSLDQMVRELAEMGYITSFCTAGYRCGRTGECIMELLRSGREGKFCKLNAVLTFQEWLDNFAGKETKVIGEKIIKKEIEEIRKSVPELFAQFMEYYQRITRGESDLYF